VWILWGPEPITARGEDRIAAVTIGKHGLQIARGHARGLLLPGVAIEHGFDARTFLEQVCIKAGLPTDAWQDDETTLMRFEGEAIEGPMLLEVVEDRPAAVAGGFYPGDPRGVQEMLDRLFAFDEPPTPQPWAAALAPHAGWVYSGRLAAAVLSRVAIPDCVIILCPKHRPGGAEWAVAPHRRWLFPSGELDSDPELAARLAEGVPGLELDAAAHRDEHAIEVQLPLLARLAPKTRVVGITVGDSPLPELLRFGIAMSVVLRDMPERPLLFISSDMNHFADDQRTRRLDRLALDAIATLDPERVYDTVRGNRISMCGLGPCVVVMEALRWLGALRRCETVGYATSADASGDTSRVVGYAGLLFN
jgi:AmmeMemoRadiSam system protein B